MFYKIFSFEIKYWLHRPLFYIYAGLSFFLTLLIMITAAGFFEGITASINSTLIINSATGIYGLLNEMTIIVYFLLPSIIGSTIAKDYEHEMHSILYSYPFKKWEYLGAKFLSGLCISITVVLFAALGVMVGSIFPGTNPELLGPFELANYVQPFLYYIIPNLFFYGAIVFAVVTFTRSVSVGFITVLGLFLIQIFAASITEDLDNRMLAAMLDPFGGQANQYYTQYWTIYEQNENPLPFRGLIIYNRLLWTGIGLLISGLVYSAFSFSQQAFTFNFRRNKGAAITKKNFGSILKVSLPDVNLDFSFIQNLKLSWKLSQADFKYIIKSWPFIIISIVGLLISLSIILVSGEIYGTDTLPVTWQMLDLPGGFFSLFINVLTFLYAGMLIHRSRTANMDQLLHATAIPNWSILFSKFLALIKMQALLLSIIIIGGIGIQVYNGYYDFELGLYLFDLYAITFIHVMIWGLLAIFVHTLFKNYYLGFFVLLIVSIGITFLGSVGIEQDIFKFNQGPGTSYSAMNGYGSSLGPYYIYKLYWLLLGIALYTLSVIFFRRGLPESFKERFRSARKVFSPVLKGAFAISLIGFLALGSWIYYIDNVKYDRLSSKEREAQQAQWEVNYSKYKNIAQPRITAVNVDLDLFPETRNFNVSGEYVLKNKTVTAIDSIHIDHNNYISTFDFNRQFELALEDDSMNYDIYRLEEALQPGDSLLFTFQLSNKPNTIFRSNSPVRNNGTFINNGIFPSIGYQEQGELVSDDARKKYGLPPKERMAPPTDSLARRDNYISNDADWIDFETTISTSPDQIAIAPGYLQDKWTEDGRRYYHYKMDSKMINFYSFMSAEYEVVKDQWNDVNIEIYYHEGHDYNLDRMIKGVKKSLDYYTANFSPYQHQQVRIIEFPRTGGGFAQSFANTIPYSEAVGFIAQVDDSEEGGVDYPFSITAHEVAHQWFAHQVIGANVQGATMLSESMSEYSSLKVLEKEYGEDKMRIFLKDALDSYLTGRTVEFKKEKPLIYNENQQYIHYNKGSLVLYALSDYIGEDKMNTAISRYVDEVAFQEPPYTTSLELLSYFREATPDSLQYLLKDMFETITLYDNSVQEATWTELDNGKYEVNITFNTAKYRTNEEGKRIYKNAAGDSLALEVEGQRRPIESLPLNDWIDVGIFGTDEDGKEKVLYLQKHKFSEIQSTLTIYVDEQPTEVGIDPYNKLIDTISDDNRRTAQENGSSGEQ